MAQVRMRKMRLTWIRDRNMNIELDVVGEEISMSHYHDLGDDVYEEEGFVGDLRRGIRR